MHIQAEFVERFEKPNLPVVIRGAMEDWPANRRWTLDVRHINQLATIDRF